MPLKVNIKRKDPKFKGDKPRYNAVVSGPRETFTPALCRLLEIHGLAPMMDEGGLVVWSSMPQIGGAPYYLAHLLAYKHNAMIHPNCRRQAMEVVSRREPRDGIDHILGSRGALPAGRMALQVIASKTDFAVNCDENDDQRREFLEAAGWLPIKNMNPRIAEKLGTQPYRTRDPFLASNLEPFMSPGAKKLMKEKLAAAAKNIRDSKSHTDEGAIDVPAPEGLSFFPFQRKGITMAVRSPGGALIADDMGLGKAQPLDAKILTPTGWTTMGEIKVGDQVIGSNGKPTEVTGVYPQQGLREVFEVKFSDGAVTRCCKEHLWQVTDHDDSRRVLSLEDIQRECREFGSHAKFRFPLVRPVTFEAVSFDVSPRAAARRWINEGCRTYPEAYLFGSVDQRLEFLREVAKDRGHVDSRRRIHLPDLERSGEKFISDLVWSLGGTVEWEEVGFLAPFTSPDQPGAPTQPPSFRPAFLLPSRLKPFDDAFDNADHSDRTDREKGLHRKIVGIERVGVEKVQCIRVAAADSLYVTDDYILTHNTMQGIGVINALPEARRILVISQANMRIKWGREIEKWKIDPEMTVGVAESSNFPDTDVCVINYDILTKNLEAMHAVEWDLIICDEAHNMKNPEAQRTQAVLGDLLDADGARPLPLAKGGKIIHLTGTPKPNRIDELWPLISSTRPDIWGSGPQDFQIFRNRYCPPILIKKKMPSKFRGREGREIIIPMPGKPIRETELHLRLRGSGSFVRRMKRDNPDLPPKFRTPLEIPVRLSRAEKEALRSVEFDLQEMLKRTGGGEVREGESTLAGAVINQITRLDPDTPAFHEMARVRRNLGLIKAPHCAKFILDELEAENDFAPENRTKTVVFAHHKDVIKIIHAEAEKRMKGAFLVYDGSVGSAKKKQALVDRFQNDDKIRGMIISLSGNSGITLTAAARMRVAEPDWSPSNMIQIEDRIWRIGQMRNVDIGYMSVAGTLDARIGMAIASKMETDERSINSISFRYAAPSQKDRENVNDASRIACPGERDADNNEVEMEGGAGEAQASLPLFG